MEYQNDMQLILNQLNEYIAKYDIDNQKVLDAYNAIYKLIPNTSTPATTKTKTTKTKKAQANDKKDVYDLWTGLIKNGMKEI